MSGESILALLERIETDQDFRDRVLALPPEPRKDFILAAGYEVGPDDLVHLRSLANIDEFSEQDLERVAAGGTGTTVAETAGVATAATVGGLAAGASIGIGVLAAACAAELI